MAAHETTVSLDAAMYLVHHVFLPPKLPGKDDFNAAHEALLVKMLRGALSEFEDHSSIDQRSVLSSIAFMLDKTRQVYDSHGHVDESKLKEAFRELREKGGAFPIYVHAQNAGVLFSKAEDFITVEVFELTPQNGVVIQTAGRLGRTFPGRAVRVPLDTFANPDFLETASYTLAKLSHQSVADTKSKTRKAQHGHDEIRDTTHPKMVTELFFGFLQSFGHATEVSSIWKNTREEVMYCDARLPWHRSPFWLLLRVSMQLLVTRNSDDHADKPYKSFMIFFMAYLLKHIGPKLPSDLTYTMQSKISRRLLKLGPANEQSWIKEVHNIMSNINHFIQRKWDTIIAQSCFKETLSPLTEANFQEDIKCKLPELDAFIESIGRRTNARMSAKFDPTSDLYHVGHEELPHINFAFGAAGAIVYKLYAVEKWVADDLETWLQYHIDEAGTCRRLSEVIDSYHIKAASCYSQNPEALSIMFLTILELWIACDKSARSIYPILADYDIGLPHDLFNSLLLRSKNDMQRLHIAEVYLSTRRSRTRYTSPAIFESYGTSQSFAVRYFQQSPSLQQLRDRIEFDAHDLRRKKRSELAEKKDEYSRLMRVYEQSECDYEEGINRKGRYYRNHSNSCKRCRCKNKADALHIDAHEWPLPDSELEAMNTVFELQLPYSFGFWRQTTLLVLFGVFGAKYTSATDARNLYHLQDYTGLRKYFAPFGGGSSIDLSSKVKPHTNTHYRRKNINVVREEDVFLKNGMQYHYFDARKQVFVSRFDFTDKIARQCTYQLPAPSSSIQNFMSRPPPNRVIASQSGCPAHFTLEEYKALTSIPLGYRIQWQNILVQLAMPAVDFRKQELALMVSQAIHQAGPASGEQVLRSGHLVIEDLGFASTLLKHLREATERIKGNWESYYGVWLFIAVAARVLSLSPSQAIQQECIAILASLRKISFEWVLYLRKRADEVVNYDQKKSLIDKASIISLICAGSFDCDDEFLCLQLENQENAAILFQCSMFVQEKLCSEGQSAPNDSFLCLLLHRWKRLCQRSYIPLQSNIVHKHCESLNDAIRNHWPAYQAGVAWEVSDSAEHWLQSQISNGSMVHFNLLSGELLVNGVPVGYLPMEYRSHKTYQTLFGRFSLEVMPSSVAGMQFSGKTQYAGHQVDLGFNSEKSASQGSDILVRARNEHSSFELIPRRVLVHYFPVHYVDNFVHWYDIDNDCIILCPADAPWRSLSNPWKMTRHQESWILSNGSYSLLSFRSAANQMISNALSPLEDSSYIHCTVHHDSASLEIDLPCSNLQFYTRKGDQDIHARQYPGMVIDGDQSLGTLVGLRSKLLLRNKQGSRLVIIQEGNVRWEASKGHTTVNVAKRTVTRVHSYSVDEQLCRLVDNGSLHSKLFLCYLHALTSFCLVDPLTMRTGTEQALTILQSAAVKSFDRLTKENIDLLACIAKISPGRTYYPLHRREMQVVTWDSGLSFLSQHGHFLKGVQSIFNHDETMKIFHNDQYVKPWGTGHADEALLQRDLIRSSTLRVSGFGAEDHTLLKDAEYTPRDKGRLSDCFERAFKMSSFIHSGCRQIEYALPANILNDVWKFLRETSGTISGPTKDLDISELKYDAKLILSPSDQISSSWCIIHRILRRSRSKLNKYHVMLWLATMAFSESAEMTLLQMLGAAYTFPTEFFPDAPDIPSFDLSKGFGFVSEELRRAVKSSIHPIGRCPESRLTQEANESVYGFLERKQSLYETNCDRAVETSVDALRSQWPCKTPTIPTSHAGVEIQTYVNTQTADTQVRAVFHYWYSNLRLREYLEEVCGSLRRQPVAQIEVPSIPNIKAERNPQHKLGYVPVNSLFDIPTIQTISMSTSPLSDLPLIPIVGEEKPLQLLNQLIRDMDIKSASEFEKLYLRRLRESLVSLEGKSIKQSIDVETFKQQQLLRDNLEFCQKRVDKAYQSMLDCISPSITTRQPHLGTFSHDQTIAFTAGQWPRITPTLFLAQLARKNWSQLNDGWKDCIVSYALALTELYRAVRLLGFAGKKDDLIKELQNPGHQNWNPRQYPESLLLEVENGIMIRENQQQIVMEIVDQGVGTNKVMQLNMGEGKSSVIVPILASVLAQPSCLVRVIVAKPQSRQMLHILTSKLGGLIDRRIYHLPFFRGIRPSEWDAIKIDQMCRECMANGGVLLVQPEQLLSFELMCIESLIEGKEKLGRALLKTQQFFDESTRDIVDESDENFSTKFELVYAMGTQKSIELSPDRWLFMQKLLSLVGELAPDVQNRHPLSIEVNESCPGSFPRTRLLRSDAQIELIDRLAQKICDNGMENLPIYRQSKGTRQAILSFIVDREPSEQCISTIQDDGKLFTGTTRSLLLLLRGLLAGGVLAFALQRRWRVAYGLDPQRNPPTKLAVPYRGKDNPTARSEFSDPDTVIMLTCLSYYYEGLSDDDLKNAFTHVTKSDQGAIEYQLWVKDAPALSHQFRQLEGVSLEDRNYCVEHVFPALRYSKGAIDYFLAHIVFPKEMKEFPSKLSASGWDIGRIKKHPTSGFSGTNDSRDTLPLSVHQLDLPEQKHTNALVLGYLLQTENSVAIVDPRETDITNVSSVLGMVTNMTIETQVILDVGAQILESNLEVAKNWLGMLSETRCQAIVYVDDGDELMVLDRKGNVEPLLISPFAKQMENCHIYLDESHTRGTDLRLPQHYRAAVTLGANLTKDKLVQACMRMRKLGHGQSVVFLVPEEIQTKIRSCVSKTEGATLDVSDVLRWAISETMVDTARNVALWAVQGSRHMRQTRVWQEHGVRTGLTIDGAKQLLEDDARSLQQRYSARVRGGLAFLEEQRRTDLDVEKIIERCRQFADLDIASSSLYEEQERELAPEIEQEREIERPKAYEPAKHSIHEDLRHFIRTGILKPNSGAFTSAFKSLGSTTAARHLTLSAFFQQNGLLVTNDFIRTVIVPKGMSGFVSDSYQRSVQWILSSVDSSNTVRHLVIISPYEADELLLDISKSSNVTLHVYSPRSSMAYRPLDHLMLYTSPTRSPAPTIPRQLITQLNLYAGQLYLSSYDEYLEVCKFLNLASEMTPDGWTVAADGFIISRGNEIVDPAASIFRTSPVQFFKVLIAQIRRNCEDIDKTHIGKILNGDLLQPGDFPEPVPEDCAVCEA